MNGSFTTEIGRLRQQEMVNRAARYRLVQQSQAADPVERKLSRRPRVLVHRRAAALLAALHL